MSAITLICELPPAEVSQRLMRQWSKRDFLLGQPVVVSQGSGAAGTTVRGVAQGIAPDGGLRIDLGDTTETFYAGDVSLGHVSGHANVPGSE
jgi:biotin-(acetyl-CoA carboxylase) ligase